MSDPIHTALQHWLDSGCTRIGEVVIHPHPHDEFILTHHEDAGRAGLEMFSKPTAARDIATYDDAGTYRPLKTAPNLRHGWQLALANIADLRMALDLLYPAAVGMALAAEENRLTATPLRHALNRQTGMYRVTGLISNEDANTLVTQICRTNGGCLRSILWQIDEDLPVHGLPPEKFHSSHLQASPGARGIPLLCREICCHLIAAAREKVKADMRKNAPAR